MVLAAGHNFPLACPGLLGAMTVGATAVFAPDPSPEAAFAAIERHVSPSPRWFRHWPNCGPNPVSGSR